MSAPATVTGCSQPPRRVFTGLSDAGEPTGLGGVSHERSGVLYLYLDVDVGVGNDPGGLQAAG